MKEMPVTFDLNYVSVQFSADILRNVATNRVPNLTVLANVLLRYILTNFIVRFLAHPIYPLNIPGYQYLIDWSFGHIAHEWLG